MVTVLSPELTLHFNKKKRILTLQNWWWQADVKLNKTMQAALLKCLRTFGKYLNAEQIVLAEPIQTNPTMEWIKDLC